MCKRTIVAIVVLCSVAMLVLEGAQTQRGITQLVLTRKYGWAGFQECRLDISTSRGSAALNCLPTQPTRSPLSVEKALSPEELKTLRDLLSRSNFFEGDQGAGKDSRAVDGVFETLEVRSGTTVVVIVTSENPKFEEGLRQQLINLLRSVEQRLQRGTN